MRIHVLSDLHIEIASYQPQPVECDVVVLAGDIANHVRGIEWGRYTWPDKIILYVPGNHEFYLMYTCASHGEGGRHDGNALYTKAAKDDEGHAGTTGRTGH